MYGAPCKILLHYVAISCLFSNIADIKQRSSILDISFGYTAMVVQDSTAASNAAAALAALCSGSTKLPTLMPSCHPLSVSKNSAYAYGLVETPTMASPNGPHKARQRQHK